MYIPIYKKGIKYCLVPIVQALLSLGRDDCCVKYPPIFIYYFLRYHISYFISIIYYLNI